MMAKLGLAKGRWKKLTITNKNESYKIYLSDLLPKSYYSFTLIVGFI